LQLDLTPIDLEERFRVVVEHSEHFQALFGRSRFMAMRKHLTWYCRDFRGAAEMRGRMTRASSAEEVARHLAEFLAQARASHAKDEVARLPSLREAPVSA
jgi:tRNA-dihydrouridine synthase